MDEHKVVVRRLALLIAADSFGINVSSLVAVLSIFGAAMALAQAAGEPREAEQAPEEPEEQTWEQTMQ